jgi:hypothetical protein
MQALVQLGPRARYRLALAAALAVTAIVGLWTFGSSQASAHWPAPHVEATCADGGGWTVTFSVESWKKSDKGGGGNPRIEVAYQLDGGAWQALPWKGNYSFTPLNDFAFSDYVNVAAGGSSKVRIKVWTTAKWSDGYENDDPKYSDWASLPKNCLPKTTTSTTRDTRPSTTKHTKPPTTPSTICETSTTKPTPPPSTETTTTTTTKPAPESTTSTTRPTTTTTAAPTTTAPPTTAPPTTEAPTTTMVPPTPVPPVPTTVATRPTSPLPVTGLQTAGMLILAAGLMGGGFVLIRAARAQG